MVESKKTGSMFEGLEFALLAKIEAEYARLLEEAQLKEAELVQLREKEHRLRMTLEEKNLKLG